MLEDTETGLGGFTLADHSALERVAVQNSAAKLWGHNELIQERHADFLAVWHPGASPEDPPMLTIARFKRTGTYAAVTDACVLATAKTIGDVLRSLPGSEDFC
jgi:hypothetical protein